MRLTTSKQEGVYSQGFVINFCHYGISFGPPCWQLRSEETTELQHIMEEMSKMFGGRRRGTEWSVPWPYKGRFVYDLLYAQASGV